MVYGVIILKSALDCEPLEGNTMSLSMPWGTQHSDFNVLGQQDVGLDHAN